MESLNEMWGLVCEQLKASLNEVIFNIWFTPIEILSFDGEKVELAVSEFKKNHNTEAVRQRVCRGFQKRSRL